MSNYKKVTPLNYEIKLQTSDVLDVDLNPISKVRDLYQYIEFILGDMVNNLFKAAIRNTPIEKYVFGGSRALQPYIHKKYLQTNFDNLMYMPNENQDVESICNRICDSLQNISNGGFKFFPKSIFNILKQNNIVTNHESEIYQNLGFYYSENTESRSQYLICMRIVLKSNIVSENVSNVENPEFPNEILYPISKIYIYNQAKFYQHITYNYDGLRYPKYAALLLILLNKPNRNNKKYLDLLLDIDKYSCSSLMSYMIARSSYHSLIQDYELDQEKRKIILEYYDNFKGRENILKKKCENLAILNAVGDNHNMIFKMPESAIVNEIATLEKITFHQDKNHNLYYYTSWGFEKINLYFYLKKWNISNGFLNIETHNRIFNGKINFSDETQGDFTVSILMKSIQDLENKIHEMDKLYLDLWNDKTYLETVQRIFLDEFYVYRLQDVLRFGDMDGEMFDFKHIKIGSILANDIFLSTSYASNFEYGKFYSYYTIIFRIKIKPNAKNWLFLNNYSVHPDEKEILIKRATYLVVKDVNYQTIKNKYTINDIMVITMELCNTFDEALESSSADIIEVLNMYDKQIIDYTNTQRILEMPDINMLQKYKQAFRAYNKKQSQTAGKAAFKTPEIIKNLNNVIFFRNKTDSFTLIHDLYQYQTLYHQIETDKNSEAYKTIYKAPTYFINAIDMLMIKNLELQLQQKVKIPNLETMDYLETKMRKSPQVQAGGYYELYRKYKAKYRGLLAKINGCQPYLKINYDFLLQ